jgi:catechol 2,3-dioxygenase-like lactoylglutathione lyase family enzyme
VIRHVAGVGEIVDDIEAAVRFYREDLQLEVDHSPGEAYATVSVPGIAHFGIWLRSRAAEIIYGDASEFERIPLGFSIGFEVDSVKSAEESLRLSGKSVVQGLRVEPWGQQTARFVTSSGALCEVSETPWARSISRDVEVQADT